MAEVNKSIFVDLEIDIKKMTEDPDGFASDVYAQADILLSILNNKNSLKGARQEAETEARKDGGAKKAAKVWVSGAVANLYEEMETKPLHEIYFAIAEAKELVRDLELLFHSRANADMIMNSPNAMDKGLAFEQYKRLRESFNAFRTFAQLLHDKTYVPLDPKSGNYGDSRTQWPTYKYEGNVYTNYRAIAKLMDWDPNEFHNNQDLIDKLETREDTFGVEIIQVTL